MSSFKMIDDITSNLSVRIKRSYCTRHSADWVESRTKLDYTLWNIMQGNIYIEVNGISYTASEGDVVIFYPGTAYSAATDSDGCQFLYNRFAVSMGNGIDIMADMNLSGIIPDEFIGKKNSAFCKQFMKLYSTKQQFPFNLYSVFISYLWELIEAARNEWHIPFHFEALKTAPADSNILAALEYIDENFTEHISITKLAKMAAMSEKYFISYFKKVTGNSPGQYIIQCRMKKAAELLLNSDMKITEIAKTLGYANPYTFSNTFKKYYEESPVNFKAHSVY